HKIISLMIGLVVGFVLMGVAYYAQVSVDMRMAQVEQRGQAGSELLTQLEAGREQMARNLQFWQNSGDSGQLRLYQQNLDSFRQHLDQLGAVDPRYVN